MSCINTGCIMQSKSEKNNCSLWDNIENPGEYCKKFIKDIEANPIPPSLKAQELLLLTVNGKSWTFRDMETLDIFLLQLGITATSAWGIERIALIEKV